MSRDRPDVAALRLTRSRTLELVLTAAMLVIFAIDARTPIGLTFWILHLAPLGLSMFTWRPAAPLVLAATATVCTILDFYLSPAGSSLVVSQINRTIGVGVFWTIGLVGRQHIRGKLALAAEEWIRRGQTELSARLQGELAPEQVADRALEFIAEYTGALVGAAWLVDPPGTLRRVAGHALASGAPDRLAAGEGLVGRAARDGRVGLLRDLPGDYMTVRSSVGSRAPVVLALWPARVDGVVHGVFELGYLGPIAAGAEPLFERSTEALAIFLRSAAYRLRLQDALAETQRQAEELQTQQEELRVVNEELEQQASALRDTQAQQEKAQIELEETNTSLEEQTAALEAQRDELTRAQADLTRTAADLARASQYKSEFLANMSHELRTPLNSSLILAKLLADNPAGNLSDEQVKFAETIYSAGNDLLQMINDILDLARIEAGRLDLHVAVVPLARVCESLARTFEPVARTRGLALAIDLAPGTPATVDTDEGRLMQVLRNLIANALKFTERGSVHVRLERAGDRLAISVRDTGIGIAQEQHAVIFEAFRQADGTTNRKYGGSGLGLSISRDLARLLGGDLSVASEPGKGSTFTVHLPLAAAAPRPAAAPVTTPPPPPRVLTPPSAPRPARDAPRGAPVADDRGRLDPERRLLLVIEDDPTFAAILVELAHDQGFQALVAATADEGMQLAAQHRPGGILLDISLPDHSGMSVLERLKRRPETRHIPVHVVSAADVTQRALEMGAIGYLRKPVAREALLAAIQRIASESGPRVRRLLIVEDDPVQRDSLRHLLGGAGIEIVTVATVAAALEHLRGSTFDCVVTDLAFAGDSGFDLLERMAADEALSFPPVIVYTGRTLSEAEEQRLRKYSSAIILKGARSPERLLDEVTLFLHQVEADLPAERQRMLRGVRDREAIFEGRTVLIVEDDVRNVFALTSILEPKGASLRIARNGREALELLAKDPRVDIALMDIMMPEMDGLTATRRLRADPKFANLPIIALTAKAMQDDRDACLAAGANDYVAKPINVEMLLSLMRVWMPR